MHPTPRQKILDAIAHKPGPVPIDFGATSVTGIHVSVVAALREHYGLGTAPVRVLEPYQMLGDIDDDLRRAMGIDSVGLFGRSNIFGFDNTGPTWNEWRAPWGQVVLVPEDFKIRAEPNGDIFIFPAGDTTVSPSAHMPAGGYFFDTIIRQEPIDEDALDVSQNLEEFTELSSADIAHWQNSIASVRNSPRAVIATLGGTALGDIALVPAPFLRHPKGIRDITEWYVSLISRPDYIHGIFSKQCEIALKNLATFHKIAGDAIDILMVCATDFGTQISQFCSSETFDALYLPYYKKINGWIHNNTGWKTMKHSCGAIDPLLPSMIRAGFDIMNPVQCSATGMDPRHLKNTYGKNLVFWGGGVDTQKTLPFGTPAQVRNEVLERCRIFSDDGGFVFCSIHNIQALTPTENVLAMLAAVSEYNKAGA